MRFRSIHTIAAKEFQGYLNSPLGTLFMMAFLLIASFLFFRDFFLVGESTLRPFFEVLPWLYLFLLPAITMRLWSEERKLGTMELLLTAPVTPAEAVLGKFLAGFGLLALTLLLSGILPLILFWIGQPDPGLIVGGYLGALMLGASYLALGLYVSTLTDNQIIAFILSVLWIALFLAIGQDVFLKTLPEPLVPVLRVLSLEFHFEGLGRGVLDTRDLVYYGSFLFLFLYLTITSVSKRKWK